MFRIVVSLSCQRGRNYRVAQTSLRRNTDRRHLAVPWAVATGPGHPVADQQPGQSRRHDGGDRRHTTAVVAPRFPARCESRVAGSAVAFLSRTTSREEFHSWTNDFASWPTGIRPSAAKLASRPPTAQRRSPSRTRRWACCPRISTRTGLTLGPFGAVTGCGWPKATSLAPRLGLRWLS